MKQKLLSLFVAVATTFGYVSNLQAQKWTEASSTLEAGTTKEYYIYNYSTGKFLSTENKGVGADEAVKWTVAVSQNGEYTMATITCGDARLYVDRTGGSMPATDIIGSIIGGWITGDRIDASRFTSKSDNAPAVDTNNNNFYVKANDNGYSLNVYIQFYDAVTGVGENQSGDIYVGMNANGLLANKYENTYKNADTWRFYTQEQFNAIKEYFNTYTSATTVLTGLPSVVRTQLNKLVANSAGPDDYQTKIDNLNIINDRYEAFNTFLTNAANVSTGNEVDATTAIWNADASDAFNGWTNGNTGLTPGRFASDNEKFSLTFNNNFIGATTNGSIYQTVDNIPDGKYKVSATWSATSTNNSTVNVELKANDDESTKKNTTAKVDGQTIETEVDVYGGSVTITFVASKTGRGTQTVTVDDFTLTYLGPNTTTLTIPSSGYTTFSYDKGVDLTSSDFTAYRASEADANTLKFVSITALPAGQGALIKGTPGTYDVKILSNTSSETNLLKAGDGETHEGAYVLASATGYPLGFYALNGTVTVPVGKAYLEVPSGSEGIKSFVLNTTDFDSDEVTAIGSAIIAAPTETATYSLTGTKVNSNYKGIVIKNGKKILQR